MKRTASRRAAAALALAAVLAAAAVARAAEPPPSVTDREVQQAIKLGREYLLSMANPDGSFTLDLKWKNCYTALCLMTLAYMGEHPNRPAMRNGFTYLVNLDPETAFGDKEGYALPVRVMALAYLYRHMTADQQARAKQVIQSDLAILLKGQAPIGGWRYKYGRADYDFSATQWQLLALYEADRIGIEFPTDALVKAREFYTRGQRADGGWSYLLSGQSYGAMTAAGVASLQTIADLIEPGSGCPCQNGRSRPGASETERRLGLALQWLSRNFSATSHPAWPYTGTNFDEVYYWLYCLERAGILCGYKHFGGHNWYKEGAAYLCAKQLPNGSWQQVDRDKIKGVQNWAGGRIPDTCYAILFLYKGRAPVLANKLRFDGLWNPHRRDLAHLARYAERAKEQQFHWQIVDVTAPVQEWHDAPILYLSAESVPRLSDDEKAKLRRFTDTGGTLLVEAACGNPEVRAWMKTLAAEVWPEWPLAPLGADHPCYTEPYRLDQRPEIFGIQDGLRTILYFAMDDISCPWHTQAVAAKEYLFQWGVNVFTVATDRAPLRAKLQRRTFSAGDRYQATPRSGPHKTLTLARLRTSSGTWYTGANYGALGHLAGYLKRKLGVTLTVAETRTAPVTAGGVAPADLADQTAAYLTGSETFDLPEAERDALKAWVESGGFLLAEAAGGSADFDAAFRRLAGAYGWTLRELPVDHPVVTGALGSGRGYDLTDEVKFRRALRVERVAKPRAELWGLWAGARLVGLYSPLDIIFSMSPYEAWGCRGYEPPDAGAVLTNVMVYLTTRE